jgi:hypothetical protein
MRFLYYLVIFTLIFSYSALSQKKIMKVPVKEQSLPKSYPIDGTPLLWKQDQAVAQWVKEHPDYNKQKLAKTAWTFTVGSTHSWYAYNFTSGSYYLVPSTCQSIGPHSYVFVENAQWNVRVTQAAINSVENAFENETPARPDTGIYQTDVDAFGNPPDVDNDPRIIILILDIKDGYNASTGGGYTAGYFSSNNEIPGTGSNDAEIYYMDCNPTDLTDTTASGGLETALETCAHEFQHMINWNYHQTNPELTFVNEGCSMLAEINCGYPAFYPGLYANETNYPLLNWRTNDATLVLNDYSRAQRYFTYWLDQFGIGIFKHVVQDNLVGLAGLENALATDGQTVSFTQLFIYWLIANKLDNTNQSNYYGYPIHTGLAKAVSKYIYYNPNVTVTDTVEPLAAEYITFTGGSNLNITFTAPSTNNLVIEAIEEGANSNRVLNVPVNAIFSEPLYGSTYSSVNFVLIDTSTNNDTVFYSYKATGTAPTSETVLQWDNTEPTGYYAWTPNDTICVAFNAVAGGRLDSIRVALRRAGSITGGVWTYTGFNSSSTTITTPLGTKLASITASISDSATIVNNGSEYPYTIPYNNWSTVDLRTSNISTNNPFAVGFVIGRNPSAPGVMSTDYPGQDDYHSYTYLQTAESAPDPPGWYYITSSDTTVVIYLIRAYVSLITGVKQEIELTPKTFSLSQNYPNPFNPSTIINFAVPKAGKVRIAVYNQLGQQVALIADKEYSPGSYSINFNGASLASGIYFYRIETGSFTQTKKMVLLK